MARNGSGTFSLASGNPVVTGSIISSSWANNTLSDIASALTQSIAVDGQSQVTANIPFNGHRLQDVDDGVLDGDVCTIGQLANTSNTALGDALIGVKKVTGSAIATTQHAINEERDYFIESDFGAIGDGVTLDDSAFALATASGRTVKLKDGATYYLASGHAFVTGTKLICDGLCTIKLKTGAGGFNVTDTGGTRTNTDRCIFPCVSVDNVVLKNIKFVTDGVKEVVIYPIRTSGGMNAEGFEFSGLTFTGFAVGELIGLNTVGDGRKRLVKDIFAQSCGATQGGATGAYWTYAGGVFPQTTLIAIDNDKVAGVYSKPIAMENIGCKDLLHSGAALTDYGQQTDLINIIGIADQTGQGHTIDGYNCDGVGELLDIQAFNVVAKGGFAKRTYNDAIKLIHGAQYCDITLESSDQCGRSVVGIFGSTSAANICAYNNVKIGTVSRPGTYGLGASGLTQIALFGPTGTFRAKYNTVEIGNVLGDGVNLDYVVLDGTAGNQDQNQVIVHKASGFAIASVSAPYTNVKVSYLDRGYVELTMSTSQTVATATDTVVNFDTVVEDPFSWANTGTHKIRPIWPGLYEVEIATRFTTPALGDSFELAILKNTTKMKTGFATCSDGADNPVVSVSSKIYIKENEVAAATADIVPQIRQDNGGNETLSNASGYTVFKVSGPL